MSVSHEDFYLVAQKLEPSALEIDWRTSAARSYYGAFHRASVTSQICPENDNYKMGSHERVTDRFDLHKSLPARSISYVLQNMKKIRRVADYELDGCFLKCMASAQLASYSVMVDKLDAFEKQNIAKSA